METGTKNKSPGKKSGEEKASKESSEKEVSQKIEATIIRCPLTDLTLSYCPSFGCMWSNGNGGCFYRRGMTAEDLGHERGLSTKTLNTQVRKGKSEINRLIIMDSYIEFLKEKLVSKRKKRLARRINKDEKIASLVETSKTYRILQKHFSVDNFIVSQMCDENLYSEFSSRLGIKPLSVVTLTGIREIYQVRLRDRISEIKKTLRGNNKSKRRKAKGKKHERLNCTKSNPSS